MCRTALIATALTLLVGAGGCGRATSSQAGGAAAGSAEPVSTSSQLGSSAGAHGATLPARACAPGARTICVMAADSGRTIRVRVGSAFTVELHSARDSFSEIHASGAKALERLAASRSGAAAEAYYRVIGPGSVLLRSTERPLCQRGRACPQFVLLWQVTILAVR